MKTIIEYNPDINIGSVDIAKNDIILVFKKEEPVGYVHYDTTERSFRLYVNFNTNFDEAILEDGITQVDESYKHLDKLILDYPDLQFKLID